MGLYETILEAYPEFEDIRLMNKSVVLRDDSDGAGPYIERWDYSKPLPEGLTVGKP